MSTPRDDIARRLGIGRRDPLAAAVQLESAMDAMHAAAQHAGPPADDVDQVDIHHPLYADRLADRAAAGAQLATHADPLTAAEFARLIDPLQPAEPTPEGHNHVTKDPAPPGECPACDRYRAVTGEPVDVDLAGAITRTSHIVAPDAAEAAIVAAATRRAGPEKLESPTPAQAKFQREFLNEWTGPAPFISERGRVLDWRSRHDPRSRDYGVAEHRLAGRAPLVDVLLDRGPVLDQGADGACAGFAAIDAANSMELVAWHRRGYEGQPADLLDADDALTLYERAKQLDDVPGENYSGTSILAAMKAGQEQGHWGGYLWAFSVRDIAQALLQLHTPVVVGVPWGSLMASAPAGLVQIGSDGAWEGHALAVVGLAMKGPGGEAGPFFIWQNSWGESYGAGGLGYVHHRDLAWLLSQAGEAAIPQGTL